MIRQPEVERSARLACKTLDQAALTQLRQDFDCSPFESRGNVGGQWHVVHIADPQQGLNVRVVGMLAQGVYQEDHPVNFTLSYAGGNLRVTTLGAGEDALYL